MFCPPLPPDRLVENWLTRHRNPASFALHMVGIPATILGVMLLPVYLSAASLPVFWFSTALFVGGYLIQFLGHAVEGSEIGELILLKRLINRPRVRVVDVVAPRKSPQSIG